ncbi:MAG: glutamate-5-semialdehyde dehydrogenase [Pseudomonadota bacterium]
MTETTMIDIHSADGSLEKDDLGQYMQGIGRAARDAARVLARADTATRQAALAAAAVAIRGDADAILDANGKDMTAARDRQLSDAMLDRLTLDADRIEAMAQGIEAIAQLDDPVGQVSAQWQRPNGLAIERVRVPLGVIGIIYESRPNVTADAGALCIKSGNAAILRGGSESFHSSRAIHKAMTRGLEAAGLPARCLQMIGTTNRDAVGILLRDMGQFVDVIVPRGGRNLIARVQADARVPVIGHLEGICHVFIEAGADETMARSIVRNAKLRRTGICGAAETVLFDRACDKALVQGVLSELLEAGCEVRGDASVSELDERVRNAVEADWPTEYLDAIIAAAMVDGVDGAVAHIERYGSGHTECIVTADQAAADRFLAAVDSAIVLHNASTQFADGGEFGMGAEIGIATGKLHARGPVGAQQLTSYKYVVRGDGQVRP